MNIATVNRTLVNAVNTASATANGPDSLTRGQMGVFSAAGVALAPSGAATTTPFFIAVGLGNGEYRRSEGLIVSKNVTNARVHCHLAAVNKVFQVENFCTKCNEELSVKLIIKDPTEPVALGFSNEIKSFTVSRKCCDSSDANACVKDLRAIKDDINAQADGYFTAKLVDPDDVDTPGATALSESELNAWDAAVDGCPILMITGITKTALDFCKINFMYDNPRTVDFDVAIEGVSCCTPATEISVIQEITYQEGAGIDVKQRENDEADISPYRLTESGVHFGPDLLAVAGTSYIQIEVQYNDPTQSGSQQYLDPKGATLALPIGNTNAHNIAVYLDYLINGAGTQLATALAACLV